MKDKLIIASCYILSAALLVVLVRAIAVKVP
jgi:hypothetical protein